MSSLGKITISDLNSGDYNPFYKSYIDYNGESTLLESLSNGLLQIDHLFLSLT